MGISPAQKVAANDPTIWTYSIIFYYTSLLKANEGNMQVYFDQRIAEVNEAYIQSLMPIRARIHCIRQSPLNEQFRYQFSDILTTIWSLHGSKNNIPYSSGSH